MNSVEIKANISEMVKECRSIVDLAKKEVRELTEDEQKRFDELKKQIEEKKSELDELQKELDAIEIPSDEDEEKKSEEDEEKNIDEERKMKKEFNLMQELRDSYRNGTKVEIPVENRAEVSVTANAEHVIETDVWDILTPLRANNVLVQAGAKFATGLTGNVRIPVMGAGNVAWAGETAVAEDGAETFTHVDLAPKRLTAYVDITLKLLEQDSKGVEALIRQDIINAINDKLEATILGAGAGSGDEPAGIFNGKSAEANVVDTYKKLVDNEAALEEANIANFKYVLSPKAKAAFRAMAKSTKNTQLVLEGGQIDGVDTYTTSHVAQNQFVVGDFSNLVIGQWGNIELDVIRDSASLKKGCVTLVVNAFFDAKVARDTAFKFGTVQGA